MRRLRDYKLGPSINDQRGFYQCARTTIEIRAWQLDQFNDQWQTIRHSVPYFARLNHEQKLPERFSSWQQFKEHMPLMDRKTLQTNREGIHDRRRKPDFWKSTGGSTAEPVQMGAWTSENKFAQRDLWFARSWFGVTPSARLFLIWGHSHLLGTGLRGRINGVKRKLSDVILGYFRCSAYDLSDEKLRVAAESLLQFRPDYVVAYAGALDLFTRVNQDLRSSFHKLRLKVAIATAESFPKADSVEFIADILGCPVVMEYGSVETGLLAHQVPEGNFKIFWRHYFLEGKESDHLPGSYEIFITSLYPRACPLVRYRIGDLISENPDDEKFAQEFLGVVGRCNDLLSLPNGKTIHSEAFSHAVKESRSIANFQVVQSADGDIALNYVAAAPLEEVELMHIRDRLTRINPDLKNIPIEKVELLEQTIAGKTRRIFRQ